VAKFRFSRRAETDLLNIAAYTLRTWEQAQTDRYIGDLEACCEQLADNPGSGRPCGYVLAGLRRMEHGKHVVFYRQETDGVLVSRILHQRMLPENNAIDDGDE
jgi:toxin ParE1/3/4